MLRWGERSIFARILTVLALVFAVALGLCGATSFFMPGMSSRAITAGLIELAIMLLCALGMIGTTIAWLISAGVGARSKNRDPQKLLDDSDKSS